MVLTYMKEVIRLLFFLLLTICFSCEEQGLFVKCPECTAEEPDKATLEIKLKFIGNPILVKIYEGDLEDNILYDSFETLMTKYTFLVGLNKKYTLTATYPINGITYIAVDSVTPRVKYDKEQCEDPCYYVYDKVVDLRLKYTE
jgi:hypothetical protein